MEKTLKELLAEAFEGEWARYPKKDGKKMARRHWSASVKSLLNLKRFRRALDNYLSDTKSKGRWLKAGSTFFYNWEDWENTRQELKAFYDPRPPEKKTLPFIPRGPDYLKEVFCKAGKDYIWESIEKHRRNKNRKEEEMPPMRKKQADKSLLHIKEHLQKMLRAKTKRLLSK